MASVPRLLLMFPLRFCVRGLCLFFAFSELCIQAAPSSLWGSAHISNSLSRDWFAVFKRIVITENIVLIKLFSLDGSPLFVLSTDIRNLPDKNIKVFSLLDINRFFYELSNSIISSKTCKSSLHLVLHLSINIGRSIVNIILVESLDINEVSHIRN